MREILFKAKRISDGKWIEGFYVEQYGCPQIYLPNGVDCENGFDYYHIDEKTRCQYTGLTDKNGNKIWENDVVQYSNETYQMYFVVRYGEYSNDGNKDCYVGFYADWFQTLESKYLRKDIGFWVYNREIEVIGNIFDNPELIGGDTK